MNNTEIGFGLDIGTASTGWAVLKKYAGQFHILGRGTYLFDSGELVKEQKRKSQVRRENRGSRRTNRRKQTRKSSLIKCFRNNALISDNYTEELNNIINEDVFELKTKALDEPLTSAELLKCLIHTSKNRGYKSFYEVDENDKESDESKYNLAIKTFNQEYSASGCRTISEFFVSNKNGNKYVTYHNKSKEAENYKVISRELNYDEITKILRSQSRFNDLLTDKVIDELITIIFSQRDFEDGPTKSNNKKTKHYEGFNESACGKCTFYPNERRGFRGSVIGDCFALINVLSQYGFVNDTTGEYGLPIEARKEIIDTFLREAKINKTMVSNIIKRYGFKFTTISKDEGSFGNINKFLTYVKNAVEKSGELWEDYYTEPQFDINTPSKLFQISEFLSLNITPSRRKKLIKDSLPFASEQLCNLLCSIKLGETANASYKYMCESINQYMDGVDYGTAQWNFVSNSDNFNLVFENDVLSNKLFDEEIRKNTVVFRAVSQVIKIINNLIAKYGQPTFINIEVADELSKTFEERHKTQRAQKKNADDKNQVVSKIRELLKDPNRKVNAGQIERYRLYMQQDGKCMYSGQAMDLYTVLNDKGKVYEVDHIIPYSTILDNTINNKVLCFACHNQNKGKDTPIGYYEKFRTKAEKSEYLSRVSAMAKRNVSKKKIQYLEAKAIDSPETQEMLKGWKSRQLNDTRYITKVIVNYLKQYFADKNTSIYGINGRLTSMCRKMWLKDCSYWGNEEKYRDSSLNHAVDAVIIANLTPSYAIAAAESLRLKTIFYQNNNNYETYKDVVINRLNSQYGFSSEEAEDILKCPDRIKPMVRNLKAEVEALFIDDDEEKYTEAMKLAFPAGFFSEIPQMARVARKPNNRYRGVISDSNNIKIKEDDEGKLQKIKRVPITEISSKDVDKINTNDKNLINTLNRIFEGKNSDYTVKKYLDENNLSEFIPDNSKQRVSKVSLYSGAISNYYNVEKDNGTKCVLGGLKYYMVWVYRNKKGKIGLKGIRFVDLTLKNGKLFLKEDITPDDFSEHIMYLKTGDYIRLEGKGKVICEGHFISVRSINENRICIKNNMAQTKTVALTKVNIQKYHMSILGEIGGTIKCSEQLSYLKEKKSE